MSVYESFSSNGSSGFGYGSSAEEVTAGLSLQGRIMLCRRGAATRVYVAAHPQVADVSGEYFANCNVAKPRADANDEALARKLWEVSEAIAGKL